MKALQDRCVAQERVIAHLRKHNGILADEQEQYNKALHTLYKEALLTLNKEVKELTEKLKEEGARREKEQEVKATIEKELMALLG